MHFVAVFAGLALFSCNHPEPPIRRFFIDLDSALTVEERMDLLNCYDIACVERFILTTRNSRVKDVFRTMPTEVETTFDSLGLDEYRNHAVIRAFLEFKRTGRFALDEIRSEIRAYLSEQEEHFFANRGSQSVELEELAAKNYSNVHARDTIILTFPIIERGEKCQAMYLLPQKHESTLMILGKVLDKYHVDTIGWNERSVPLYKLSLEIVGMSHTHCDFMLMDLRCGSNMCVSISNYQKTIERISSAEESLRDSLMHRCR